MSKFSGIAAGLCIAMLAGCATRGDMDQVEETNQKILRENETRLHNLENSVTALNSQIAQLNNRVYEVRTRNGQKTSMTVVPIAAATSRSSTGTEVTPGPTTPAIGQGASSAAMPRQQTAPAQPSSAPKSQPVGRKIDPAAKPTPLPAQPVAPTPQRTQAAQQQGAGAAGSIGQLPQVGGPAGQIATGSDTGEIGLPPSEIPVPQNNVEHANSFTGHATTATISPQQTINEAIPVPLIPASDLSLPPENPDLPAPSIQQPASQASAPTPAPSHAPAASSSAAGSTSKPAQGEEAAYKAALNAARSGHTEQGIRLFRDFLEKYPNGRYTANADYWIGECLYAQGKYQDALTQFQTVNNSFPRHHKNADALLKAAMTLTRLGDKAGAQEKFRDLLSSFPNSDAARRARAMGAGR